MAYLFSQDSWRGCVARLERLQRSIADDGLAPSSRISFSAIMCLIQVTNYANTPNCLSSGCVHSAPLASIPSQQAPNAVSPTCDPANLPPCEHPDCAQHGYHTPCQRGMPCREPRKSYSLKLSTSLALISRSEHLVPLRPNNEMKGTLNPSQRAGLWKASKAFQTNVLERKHWLFPACCIHICLLALS